MHQAIGDPHRGANWASMAGDATVGNASLESRVKQSCANSEAVVTCYLPKVIVSTHDPPTATARGSMGGTLAALCILESDHTKNAIAVIETVVQSHSDLV